MRESILVVAFGSFGQQVGRWLSELVGDTVTVESATPAQCADARLIVVAASRPMPQICEQLDLMAHEGGRPFIPVTLDSRTLTIGPAIRPAAGSCWRCWSRRVTQHATHPDVLAALGEHYDANPQAGPRGYLEPLALIGASQLAHVIDGLLAGSVPGGYVWQLQIATRDISTSTVVGLHDCPRCGLQRPVETRTIVDLAPTLSYLWS